MQAALFTGSAAVGGSQGNGSTYQLHRRERESGADTPTQSTHPVSMSRQLARIRTRCRPGRQSIGTPYAADDMPSGRLIAG